MTREDGTHPQKSNIAMTVQVLYSSPEKWWLLQPSEEMWMRAIKSSMMDEQEAKL